MRLNDAFYRDLLDNLYDGVYFVDADRRITYWNRGAESITGYRAGEVLGFGCMESILVHVDEDGRSLCATDCPLEHTLADGRERELAVYLHHRDGHRVPVLVRISPLTDEEGCVTGAVEVFSENTSQMVAVERVRELEERALIDPLTGVGNRRYTQMRIEDCLAENQRYGWRFGLLFIDIDHFKSVNDTYGHAVGDDVLKVVSRTLRNSLRPFDFLGRWGGEEFIALIVNLAPPDLASVAERSRLLVERSQLSRPEGIIDPTVSVGAAVSREADTVESIVGRADKLMYRSKQAGRNRVTMQQEP